MLTVVFMVLLLSLNAQVPFGNNWNRFCKDHGQENANEVHVVVCESARAEEDGATVQRVAARRTILDLAGS